MSAIVGRALPRFSSKPENHLYSFLFTRKLRARVACSCKWKETFTRPKRDDGSTLAFKLQRAHRTETLRHEAAMARLATIERRK